MGYKGGLGSPFEEGGAAPLRSGCCCCCCWVLLLLSLTLNFSPPPAPPPPSWDMLPGACCGSVQRALAKPVGAHQTMPQLCLNLLCFTPCCLDCCCQGFDLTNFSVEYLTTSTHKQSQWCAKYSLQEEMIDDNDLGLFTVSVGSLCACPAVRSHDLVPWPPRSLLPHIASIHMCAELPGPEHHGGSRCIPLCDSRSPPRTAAVVILCVASVHYLTQALS